MGTKEGNFDESTSDRGGIGLLELLDGVEGANGGWNIQGRNGRVGSATSIVG
ncbi:hypothetical protein A2U01_0060233, partial [Trifolium medium]|nr:hypothetical protein [Trifolium medium]